MLMNSAYEEGIEKWIKKGKEEAVRSRNVEIAKSMLEEKMKPPLISKITGLSIDEIESL